MRPSTASTTSGSTSIVAKVVSRYLAPWLETITPLAPCSALCLPSSPTMIPLTTTGSLVLAASQSRSSQVEAGSRMSLGPAGASAPNFHVWVDRSRWA